METLIVGAGEMGRWAGSVAAEHGPVTFADTNAGVAERAAEAVDGTVVPLEADDAFDLVILAVPIPAVAGAIRQHAPKATGAVVDVAGTMTTPMETYADHAVSEYASFHPLFAPLRAPGRIAYVPGRTAATVGRLVSAFEAAGNEVFETTAAEHDAAMKSVQGAAHAATLAYALATEDVDDAFATPVSEQLEAVARTVTSGDPRVYADISTEFDGAQRVARAAQGLASADDDRFRELFTEARERVGADPREQITDDSLAPDASDGDRGDASETGVSETGRSETDASEAGTPETDASRSTDADGEEP